MNDWVCRHGHVGWGKRRVKFDLKRERYYFTWYCQECDRLSHMLRRAA